MEADMTRTIKATALRIVRTITKSLSIAVLAVAATTTFAEAQFAGTQTTWMERRANTYVEGEGYDTIRGLSQSACEAQCRNDSGCAMAEFFKPETKCNLFRHARTAGYSREANVAIKRSWTPRQPAMRRLADSYVIGEGYETHRRASADLCQTLCVGDTTCAMSEFYKPERKCNLYSHRNTRAASGNSAIVAVKE
jgi:PAN domain